MERPSLEQLGMALLREGKRFAFSAVASKPGLLGLFVVGEGGYRHCIQFRSHEGAQSVATKLNKHFEISAERVSEIVDASLFVDEPGGPGAPEQSTE